MFVAIAGGLYLTKANTLQSTSYSLDHTEEGWRYWGVGYHSQSLRYDVDLISSGG